jgi:hypothetical protein
MFQNNQHSIREESKREMGVGMRVLQVRQGDMKKEYKCRICHGTNFQEKNGFVLHECETEHSKQI